MNSQLKGVRVGYMLLFECFPEFDKGVRGAIFVLSCSRRLRGHVRLLRAEQENGVLHHPDLHPLHTHRRSVLGVFLDQ